MFFKVAFRRSTVVVWEMRNVLERKKKVGSKVVKFDRMSTKVGCDRHKSVLFCLFILLEMSKVKTNRKPSAPHLYFTGTKACLP